MKSIKINDKWPILLPDHRITGQWANEWEKKRLDSMGENIGKGDVVYYCGAELGEMPALCSIWGAEVVLFEPNNTAWPTIKKIWEANKLGKPLGCFAGFVSNIHQPMPKNPDLALKAEIFKGHGWENQPDGWPLFAQQDIIEDHGFSELHHEADGLPQFRIDSLVFGTESLFDQIAHLEKRKAIVPVPTVLIIDVEGAEFEVLKGAEETINEFHPKIWLSLHPEFLFGNWGVYSRNLRDWLIGHGYNEEFLDYQHEVHFLYTAKEKS